MMVFLQPITKELLAVSIMALQLSLESYFVFPDSTFIEVRPVQPENASSPILVTLFGMVIELRPAHPEKAELPILVTLLPMVTEVRPVQLPNASSPILVTLLGMVTVVRPEQLEYLYVSVYQSLPD